MDSEAEQQLLDLPPGTLVRVRDEPVYNHFAGKVGVTVGSAIPVPELGKGKGKGKTQPKDLFGYKVRMPKRQFPGSEQPEEPSQDSTRGRAGKLCSGEGKEPLGLRASERKGGGSSAVPWHGNERDAHRHGCWRGE